MYKKLITVYIIRYLFLSTLFKKVPIGTFSIASFASYPPKEASSSSVYSLHIINEIKDATIPNTPTIKTRITNPCCDPWNTSIIAGSAT